MVMARINPERSILTIVRHEGVWSVELDGETFGHSSSKDEARASANKQARLMQDGGRPCEIRVEGEIGFGAR